MTRWREVAKRINASGLRVFGEAVLHYPAGSIHGLPRRGVFNEIYQGVDAETGFPITSAEPNLGIINKDWPRWPNDNDRIVIRDQEYRFRRAEKDGEAGSILFLTRNIIQENLPTQESGFGAVARILNASQRVFGGPVTFQPVGGGSFTLSGIFSDRYEGPDPDTGLIIIAEKPNLGIRIADWPVLPQDGDRIIFEGTLYRTRAPHVDGEGGATIILDKIKTPNDIGADFSDDFSDDFEVTT